MAPDVLPVAGTTEVMLLLAPVFDRQVWAAVPSWFWAIVLFVFGTIVGSFLNVCIHRMPRNESIVSPPSHCPHCLYSIPWFLNVPLFTWTYLRGKCAHCGARISFRYFLVELCGGLVFLVCWLAFGPQGIALVLTYGLLLCGFVVATFIDVEFFIIPDEITLGGIAVGFLCSFAVPALQHSSTPARALENSFLGILVGGGLIYAILRIGKLLFGKQKLTLAPESRIVFTESALQLPDQEILYEDLFYRKSDTVVLQARTVEMIDRCYANVPVRLSPVSLQIGEETFSPEAVPHLEVTTDEIVLPREAMGLGDVKFMAAIGAFLGWPAVVFSLMMSAMIGSFVGVSLIVLRKQSWSSRLPYGPYIALAATIWVFFGPRILRWWLLG